MSKPLFAGSEGPAVYTNAVKLAGYGASMLKELKALPASSVQSAKDESGMNAMCQAAKTGDVEVIKYLLDIKCDVNVRAWGGMTPLMLSALNIHEFAVSALVKAGASVSEVDDFGNTAAHYAAKGGSLACLNELIEQRATSNADGKSGSGSTVVTYNKALIDMANTSGKTALHLACNHGQQAIVSALLKAGADVNVADAKGYTALHVASSAGFGKLCQMLLEAGASKDAKTAEGVTASNLAATSAVHAVFE